MTAIQSMKRELLKIQKAQDKCVSESGYVYPCFKYRYQLLIEKAKAFKDSIKWMESLYDTQPS